MISRTSKTKPICLKPICLKAVSSPRSENHDQLTVRGEDSKRPLRPQTATADPCGQQPGPSPTSLTCRRVAAGGGSRCPAQWLERRGEGGISRCQDDAQIFPLQYEQKREDLVRISCANGKTCGVGTPWYTTCCLHVLCSRLRTVWFAIHRPGLTVSPIPEAPAE